MSGVQKLLVMQVHTHQGQGGRKGGTLTNNMNEWVASLFGVGGHISKEKYETLDYEKEGRGKICKKETNKWSNR